MKRRIPPPPPGWNKTLDDLFAETKRGERLGLAWPETEWAREYERSQIPRSMRFPRKGDVYEVLQEMPVHYMVSWAAPCTTGGEGLLKKGDRVVVKSDPGERKPIGTYAEAVDYAALEQRMVPAEVREAERYGGFYFHFKTVELNRRFRLVHEA